MWKTGGLTPAARLSVCNYGVKANKCVSQAASSIGQTALIRRASGLLESVAGRKWPIRSESKGRLIGGHPVSLFVRNGWQWGCKLAGAVLPRRGALKCPRRNSR